MDTATVGGHAVTALEIVVYGQPAWTERFWAKVDRGDPDDCWPWIAARDKNGYGSFWLDGRQVRAPRIAWCLVHPGKPIPADRVVRHTCDNPPCTNPADLIIGTSLDNDLDRMQRGRSACGDRNGSRLYPERLVRGAGSPQYRTEECRNGHPLSRRYISASGERRCTDCQADRARRYRARSA